MSLILYVKILQLTSQFRKMIWLRIPRNIQQLYIKKHGEDLRKEIDTINQKFEIWSGWNGIKTPGCPKKTGRRENKHNIWIYLDTRDNIFVTEFLTGKIMKIQFKTQVNWIHYGSFHLSTKRKWVCVFLINIRKCSFNKIYLVQITDFFFEISIS